MAPNKYLRNYYTLFGIIWIICFANGKFNFNLGKLFSLKMFNELKCMSYFTK